VAVLVFGLSTAGRSLEELSEPGLAADLAGGPRAYVPRPDGRS